jgi:hypothetical protein
MVLFSVQVVPFGCTLRFSAAPRRLHYFVQISCVGQFSSFFSRIAADLRGSWIDEGMIGESVLNEGTRSHHTNCPGAWFVPWTWSSQQYIKSTVSVKGQCSLWSCETCRRAAFLNSRDRIFIDDIFGSCCGCINPAVQNVQISSDFFREYVASAQIVPRCSAPSPLSSESWSKRRHVRSSRVRLWQRIANFRGCMRPNAKPSTGVLIFKPRLYAISGRICDFSSGSR